jgi:hypothetical protein
MCKIKVISFLRLNIIFKCNLITYQKYWLEPFHKVKLSFTYDVRVTIDEYTPENKSYFVISNSCLIK